MRLLTSGLFLLCAAAVQANPLLANTPVNPLTFENSSGDFTASYQGVFSNASLTLELRSRQNLYEGKISFNGRVHPLRGSVQADILQGAFRDGNKTFFFTAVLAGDRLTLETDGTRFVLNRQTNPGANPGAMPAPFSPVMADPVLSTDPNELSAEYHALSVQTINQLRRFLSGLKRWLGGTASAAEQQLIPGTLILQGNLARLSAVAERMTEVVRLSAPEVRILHRLSATSNKGAEFFYGWHTLLTQVLQLHHAGNKPKLKTLAVTRLPVGIRNTVALTRNLVSLIQTSNRIKQIRTMKRASSASLNPSKFFKWETLRNMSEMMRDGMDILNKMKK
ncbi:MAG: hypothetical protein GY862_33785 [Gammaproteobacteria bacterium]|nr:hypothetical protein [Gammaproteobacteria bacterium]